ncbi:Proline dehydrogenase / Delta-1-pyrroline-5-carboxylate dehydrogenase [hydrothermal vent metagenome]|uniref:Proline dehydrogenase / Delta-1-pyrroline-5-carboxylate dehydrogenase n=1 Tax=hydrothermal vent metagenome TaxID=652676 RepID=A0A3B0TZV4_9ZZZZ
MPGKAQSQNLFTGAPLPDQGALLSSLLAEAQLDAPALERISDNAASLVEEIRSSARPGLMEAFLGEYGLSSSEGVALMCLAEALLRVPDALTIDALIEDKIAASNWRKHLGHSTSALVNASTWALMLTGKVLQEGEAKLVGTLHSVLKRLGEPLIRTAVSRAIHEMGAQFVLGQDMAAALKNARAFEEKGFTYSYDMLGEAALTEADAKRYHLSYSAAISTIAASCTNSDIRLNPGISVKLSALHPRYEFSNRDRVLSELVPRLKALALLAKTAGIGFNIDAEEIDRLALSLEVIDAVLSEPALKGWDGFGVVVQTYSLRAGPVLDWLYQLAKRLDRKIMVRLVKGAYWDAEIKHAQMLGLANFEVFTRKAATDVSYIANAHKLLGMRDRLYPQFATHNAHTVCAILEMAGDDRDFEFQRLHGMGENLYDIIMQKYGANCRIYAPVGAHRDLLAYLVRRLLENGANSSFVNQIVDKSVPAAQVAADPFTMARNTLSSIDNPAIRLPPDLFGSSRKNSRGWNLSDQADIDEIEKARAPFRHERFTAAPIIVGTPGGGEVVPVVSPYDSADHLGSITQASPADVERALASAAPWEADAKIRAKILNKAADLFEENFGVFFALAAREAGKTLPDAVSELREAVDFLRYYAHGAAGLTRPACGTIAAISPWNFPLAIFTGQIAAALAAANAVLAKPAEQTPLIAAHAISLLHEAGVPLTALQFLPGPGPIVGAALSSDPRIDGICFTGSTITAQNINRAMAKSLSPNAPLIAETGGLNAMIVDSSALHQQAVRDIIASAFQSAGQRCSSLRILYLQRDIAAPLLKMLFGAMDELRPGDPWDLATDTGPVIDIAAAEHFRAYIERYRAKGKLLKQLPATACTNYIAPTVLKVDGIGDLKEEIFGPVLHVATFAASEISSVLAQINASGFGLTFGVHSRIDERIQQIIDTLEVGNIYVNRNQVGAIVGSQPFGGEKLSGTGPKAGGPNYLNRLTRAVFEAGPRQQERAADLALVQKALDALPAPSKHPLNMIDLPGPTGEANQLSIFARGKVLCLGPGKDIAKEQASEAIAAGCSALCVTQGGEINGILAPDDLSRLSGFCAIVFWGQEAEARALRIALARRSGELIPLVTGKGDLSRYHVERHVCIDTTASGGNAELLVSSA